MFFFNYYFLNGFLNKSFLFIYFAKKLQPAAEGSRAQVVLLLPQMGRLYSCPHCAWSCCLPRALAHLMLIY